LDKNASREIDKGYMVQLDGFRFLAVTGVMIGHWMTCPFMNDIGPMFASCGVNLFFVLSGFLITQILIKSKLNVSNSKQFTAKQFYIRRFIRIFPLYYLVIFLGWLLKIPSGQTPFVWFVTYTTNIVVVLKSGDCGYFSHLWSLAVEEQFYLIFPFIVLLVPVRKLLKAFFIVIAVALVSRGICYFLLKNSDKMGWATYTLTPCCFDSFGAGAILAYLKVFSPDYLQKILQKKLLFLGVLVFWIATYYLSKGHPRLILPLVFSYRFTFSVFCFWLIGVGSLSGFKGVVKYILENRVIVYLGRITYGIYVYHHFMPFIFEQIGYDDKTHPLMLNFVLYFSSTILVSSLSWHLFEKPINDLKRFFNYNASGKTKSYIPVSE
jgi:peptidoglycan/LPS O-acetylase OafA/YrhL